MTSTKIQINLNDRNLNIQTCFEQPSARTVGQVLVIDIWNLFVIYFLLFGALIQNLFDFIGELYIVELIPITRNERIGL